MTLAIGHTGNGNLTFRAVKGHPIYNMKQGTTTGKSLHLVPTVTLLNRLLATYSCSCAVCMCLLKLCYQKEEGHLHGTSSYTRALLSLACHKRKNCLAAQQAQGCQVNANVEALM